MNKFTMAFAALALIAGASSASAMGGAVRMGGYASLDDYNAHYRPIAPVAPNQGFSALYLGGAPRVASPTGSYDSAVQFSRGR